MRISSKDRVGTTVRKFKILDWKRENNRSFFYITCPRCGKNKWMRADDIVNGKSISCGCYNKEVNHIKEKDLTNKTFGRLKAISPTNKRDSNGAVIWNCKCDCGNTKNVSSKKLLNGSTSSCGCLRKEKQKENGVSVGEYVKNNHVMNNTNIKSLTANIAKNNTSGFKGIMWDKARKKWKAEITFQKKVYYLGRYTKKEEAIKARQRSEKELFGNFLEWYETEYPKK